jgi:beta-glucosidase
MEDVLQERLAALSLEQKVRLLTGADFWSLYAEPAIGLRRIVMSDGPAGVRGELWDERDPAANVPSPTALAATWDVSLVERLGRLLAYECRRKGVDVLLAPTVNLHRSPFGGRHFECFSEDPWLTGAIGGAYVRGLQSEGVAATVKHFVANDSETERLTLNAVVDERVLRELYLAPFETILAEHPWAIMAAYNGVNGALMTESPMLRDLLKDEWNYDGLVMSDWGAARSLDAARAALDLVMPGPTGPWGEALVEAVHNGEVPTSTIDDKVLRILRLAERVGALDTGSDPRHAAAPTRGPASPDTAAELRALAAASFVLARNHGSLLPLTARTLRTVAVIGPNAALARTLGGGSATVFPPYTVSPLDGLRAALAHADVRNAPGVRAHTRLPVADISAELRFFAADGTLLSTEQREIGEFTWLGTLDPAVAAIEVHTTITAETDGEHAIGCSGAGRYRLTLDGSEAFDERLSLGPDPDPGEMLFAPPSKAVPVALTAGPALHVVLTRFVAADDGGLGVSFQLNFDTPFGDDELERAVELARDADVAIVVVGTTPEVESEGFDRASLALPGRQDELVRRINEANPKTIAVVNAGAPVLMPWLGNVPAVLLTWFPGQEAGNALADVLLGAAEPGGRLPTTWPASEAGLPSVTPVDGELPYDEGFDIGYRGDVEPLLPFGHGLGYTSWEYLAMDGATVRLANTGTRAGREVIQVYVTQPELRLAGFAVVAADAGAEVIVDVPLGPRALQRWGAQGWEPLPGPIVLEAGRSVADLRLRSRLDP